MNAHCERFNHIIWDEFAKFKTSLLGKNIPEFNRKMLDWLLGYNCKRPHATLRFKTPSEAKVEYCNCNVGVKSYKARVIAGT